MIRKRVQGNSRNGCITCKIRHIKCDEERPACLKCTKTGRKCDGYSELPPRRARKDPRDLHVFRRVTPGSNPIILPGTRQERDFLHMFATETCHSLTGYFHSDIWIYYIPQLCHTQPVIRHAVAAVSATHKLFLSDQTYNVENERFALEQYNRAIRGLLESQKSHSSNLDLTLITCSLFISLETMRNNRLQAMSHAESGLRLLARRQLLPTAPKSSSLRLSETINQELSDLFSLFNIDRAVWGQATVPYESAQEQSTKTGKITFTTLASAKRALIRHIYNFFKFIERVTPFPHDVPKSELQSQIDQQKRLKKEHRDWLQAFRKLQKRLSSSRNQNIIDHRAPLVLIIQYHTIAIWNETILRENEMVYDDHVSQFEEIVEAAEEFKDLCAKTNERTLFTLEPHISISLCWVSRKCRHPLIRRRAAEVIKSLPRQGGTHNSIELYHLALYHIDMEEASLAQNPVHERIPGEKCRVWDTISLDSEESSSCLAIFVFRDSVTGEYEQRQNYVKW